MSEQSLEELLRASREDFRVEDETEVVLEPENQQVARARHVVEIRAFADLQELSLIPEWLTEDGVQEAIARDDEESRSLAREYMTARRAPCDCEGDEVAYGETPFKLTHRSEYRRAYVGIRKTYSPNLADLMTVAGRGVYDPSDLHVSMIQGWFSVLQNAGVFQVPIWLFADVEIGKNATLTLGLGEKALYCGDLRIHVGGKLVIKGSGAKVRCATAQGNLP